MSELTPEREAELRQRLAAGCYHTDVPPLLDEIDRLRAEVERLKRGDFTPEEFQNICHDLDQKPGCTAAEFNQGCEEKQRELFGVSDVDGWRKANAILNKGMESQAEIGNGLKQEVRTLRALLAARDAELARLRRGDFTPEEFQNLCHHRDEKPGCTEIDFKNGCAEYWKKLFGEMKDGSGTI